MHFLKKTILLLPLASLLFASCDNVSEDERFIPVEQVTAKRAVLLEEFTGQWCRNCPQAHEIIAQLKAQYGDAFIPVSIHAGPGANALDASESYAVDDQGLKQAEGDVYANMWNISSYPQGVFNRTSGVLSRDKWAAQLALELQKDASLGFELSATYDAATNSVNVKTIVEPFENIHGYLQLWLVESNIVSMQQNGDELDFEYVHNHVFRTSINGTQGEAVNLTANVFASYENTVALQQYWQSENLSVVAFVYNNDGVLQAAEVAVDVPAIN